MCVGIVFFMFFVVSLGSICLQFSFTMFEIFEAIISSNIYFSPSSFGVFNENYIRLLEIISQITDILFIEFFSLCVSFWILSITSSTPLIFSLTMSNLLFHFRYCSSHL